ncbi:alanine racemase [Candidatus Aerophobetes bacterium]|nr:alanine racemase [Candidatus Aerophobetes bacterium]
MLRPTRVEIDLDAVVYNLRQIRLKVGENVKIMAVVKADAYGHGALEIAKAAISGSAEWLGVANVEEGVKLREGGIKNPILVLGLSFPEEGELAIKYELSQTVCTLEFARNLSIRARKIGKPARVHVKIDTGMGRIGIIAEEAVDFIKRLLVFDGIKLEGIFSHFARAEEKNGEFTTKQIQRFNMVINELEREGIKVPIRHIANSAAILNFPATYFDMVRPGIMIYGLYPSDNLANSLSLKPVMSFKTCIVYLKDVPPGTSLGYGRSFVTRKKSKIATLPVGYADGYSRKLSGKSCVLIRGKRAPVVGRICMDMMLVDVSHIPDVKIGDEVVLFGRQGEEEISVQEIASLQETINYEILCNVGNRVFRVYLKRGSN